MSRRTPGMPIPGTEKTVTAAEIAAELGLQPGSAPKDAKPRELTPNQARLKMSDRYVGEPPDDGRVEYVVSAGRDVLDLLGVDPASLPLGVEQELGAPQRRPERRHREGGAEAPPTPSPPPADDAAAKAKLAADFRAHAAKVAAIAEAAKGSGDADREARAAAEVAASRQVGEALKARGILESRRRTRQAERNRRHDGPAIRR